jgi:hypothetical protein
VTVFDLPFGEIFINYFQKMNSKEIETINTEGLNVKQRFGFIPKRLESDTKPEL